MAIRWCLYYSFTLPLILEWPSDWHRSLVFHFPLSATGDRHFGPLPYFFLSSWSWILIGWIYFSWQLAVGSWQLAVGGWQLAVGSWQLTVGSWQDSLKKNRKPFSPRLIISLSRFPGYPVHRFPDLINPEPVIFYSYSVLKGLEHFKINTRRAHCI